MFLSRICFDRHGLHPLERAQELLFFLKRGVTEGRLANSIQVYLDSPMAISATESSGVP